jgi:hypothetical protein
MKRIVTLVLMMLIGGYGAIHAETEDESQTQNQNQRGTTTETESSTKEFLGLKWGLGIGVMGSFGGATAVEKASLVGTGKIVRVDEEGDFRPQTFLEMHAFMMGNKATCWRQYQKRMSAWREAAPESGEEKTGCPKWSGDTKNQEPPRPDPPLMGLGPFVALQGSENKVINALTVGFMMGRRKGPTDVSSVNIGVGLSFDPSVQVLGHGIKEGQPLPDGESAVRFKKEGRFGWALMTSFTF